jgi:cyanophycin synthetase
VLAMRRQARGRPFLFSMDPDHPALRQVLARNGRAIAPLDGALALLTPGPSARPLVVLEDVPLTLAGISSHHIQNAMAAAAAGLALGLSLETVAEGLRTFVPDAERNPGRANLFEVEGRVVIVDYAHNEVGMQGLVEIARGLRRPGARIWIVICAAGDRTDEVMHALGYVSARGADRVGIAELPRYLRGREPQDIVDRLRAGAVDGGAARVPDFPDEVAAVRWMLRGSARGDVLAIAALSHRDEVVELLRSRGARRVGARRCRQLVLRARSG